MTEEPFADFCPGFVLDGSHDKVVAANIVNDASAEGLFEAADAIVGVFSIVDFVTWWRSTEVV